MGSTGKLIGAIVIALGVGVGGYAIYSDTDTDTDTEDTAVSAQTSTEAPATSSTDETTTSPVEPDAETKAAEPEGDDGAENVVAAETDASAVSPDEQGNEPLTLAGNPTLIIEVGGATSGRIEIELLANIAPGHVARIVELAEAGRYDNVVFHRVIDGFMAQTGDVEFGTKDASQPSFTGRGGSGLADLKAEFSDEPYVVGTVGMARSNSPDSANSQFFIMFAPAPFLEGQYTVVGNVIAGQDVVNALKKGDSNDNGAVQDPDYMAKVSIKQ